jgi:CDP-diacylglycerol---serine O-phosphatidyltransferase
MNIKNHIPNTLTSLNLFSGCVAIVFVFTDLMHLAAILTGFAAFFDFLDGMTARLLKANSKIGKELDSLADMVSFGVVPGAILFQYLQQSTPDLGLTYMGINLISLFAFLIPVFSALRLARFNIDERQHNSFIGLPTPANAIFFVSIPFVLYYGNSDSFFFPIFNFITNKYILILALTVGFSALLVLNIPLFSLKIKNFNFQENKVMYFFLAGVILLYVFFGVFAIPLTIIYYIILSLTNNIYWSSGG